MKNLSQRECAELLKSWGQEGCPMSDRAVAIRHLLRSGIKLRHPRDLLERFLKVSAEAVSAGRLYFHECEEGSEQGNYALERLSESIRGAAELLLEIQDLEESWGEPI